MKRFGLPDSEFKSRLAGLFEEVSGGWLVGLAQVPPDLVNEEDRERTQWVYRRVGKDLAQHR